MSIAMAVLMVLTMLWTISVPVNADNEESHVILFAIDGARGVSVRISFSYDNWTTAHYVCGSVSGGDAFVSVEPTDEESDGIQVDFRLEDYGEVPDDLSALSVKVEIQDTPQVDGGATRIIAFAQRDPWGFAGEPVELSLDPNYPTVFQYDFQNAVLRFL